MKNILILLFSSLPGFLLAQQPDSLSLALEIDSLVQVNRTLLSEGSQEEALQVIERAKSKAESAFGKGSAQFAECAHNHGRTFYYMGAASEAEQYYLEADSIWKILGRENASCAQNLFNLGLLYYNLGYYKEAEPLFIECTDIRKRVLGEESNAYFYGLIYQAYLYDEMGKFDLAEPLYLQCKDIRKNVWGVESLEYADILSDLSIFNDKLGRYEEAEPLQLEALAIRKQQGEESLDYAASLSNLGVLYQNMGRYKESEQVQWQAKDIREKLLGKEDTRYGDCLVNLATVYLRTGRYDQAEPLLLEGLAIQGKQGKESPGYTLILNNLGVFYWTVKRYEDAEPIFLEALRISEKQGKDRPEYIESLNNLGNLYWATGRYEDARLRYLEAKELRGKNLGKDHPDYAQSLNNLAVLYQDMGLHDKADPLFQEARVVIGEKLGKEHPFYTDISDNLAINKCLLQQSEEAKKLFLEINEIRRDLITQYSRYLSELDLTSYISLFITNLEEFYSFSQNYSKTMPGLSAVCYDNALIYKGFLLETINRRKNLIRVDPQATQLYNQQKMYLRRLASEYAKPIAERDQAQLAAWKEKTNQLEKELVQTLEGYAQLGDQVYWKEVQGKLEPEAVAIEFIHFRYHNPEPTDSTMYAALILFPGEEAPRLIPLFEEQQLLSLLTRPGLPDELIVKDLYGNRPDLYRLFGKPLEPLLREIKTVYYSPSGLLHFIDPAALLDESGTSISEGRHWVRLCSTRDLVIGDLADASFAQGNPNGVEIERTAALYGAIVFDMDSIAFVAANPSDPEDPVWGSFPKDGDFQYMVKESGLPTGTRGGQTGDWAFLPGTEREVDEIDAILRKAGFHTEVKKGYFASEECIKNTGLDQPSPRILLLATHGFAYPNPPKEPAGNMANAASIFKMQDDPMLRSGLLLAGANYYWSHKRPLMNCEDGVLVAYEVRDLNLNHTELAVLSACQTGLGDQAGSEGVYGLQRAFRIAGVNFLIVSLWKVPDTQTKELMVLFYQNWVSKGVSLRAAFQNARLEMKKKYPNPYLWAGFVLIE